MPMPKFSANLVVISNITKCLFQRYPSFFDDRYSFYSNFPVFAMISGILFSVFLSYNLALLYIQEQSNPAPIVKYRLITGKPSAGKSPLANCITESVLLKSGIAFGSGKTFKLDKEEHGDILYLDTPGLADIKMQQAAASVITEGL